jgi:D-lactate dehydrogenase
MYHSTNNKLQLDKTLATLNNLDFSQYMYVILDNSSCSGFVNNLDINITDINDVVVKYIHNITFSKSFNKVALHLDCSTRKQDNYSQYISVIDSMCSETIIPEYIYCCGFAGDKGFTTPELNSSSLTTLKDQVYDCDIGVSFNRTCQIGLTENSSINYISFVEFILMSIKEG